MYLKCEEYHLLFVLKKKQKGIVTKIVTEEKFNWAYLDKDGVERGSLLGFGRKKEQKGNFNKFVTHEKDEWACLDKTGIDIGGVIGSDKEAVINYVNCATGASIFIRPVCTLVRENVSLDVSEFVIFIRMKDNDSLIGLNVSEKGPEDIEELVIMGLKLFYKGHYEAAISCYNKVLGMDSQNVGALNNKAIVLDELGRYDEATEHFDKILKIDPTHFVTLTGKGLTLERKKKYEDALTCFNKTVEIYPKIDEALINKKRLLDKMRKSEK